MARNVLKKIYIFLDKVKFFGLRKIFYLLKNFFTEVYYRELFVKDIFSPSLNNRFLSKKIIDYFKADTGHNLDPKKTFLGFGLIHYSLIRNIKPQRVLCIGSRNGFIPAILAMGCKDNKKGHVDFVDAGFDKNDRQHWSGIGFWRRVNPKKHFNYLNLNKWLSTYVMTSAEFAQKFPQKKYDYIYVDGDHSYKGVKLDYKLFWSKLRKNGLMVFHDVIVKEWGELKEFGVWKFWQELKDKNKITFPFPKESGLGILQKR